MYSHTHTVNSSECSGNSWVVGQIILWQLIFAVGFFFGIQYGDLVRLF